MAAQLVAVSTDSQRDMWRSPCCSCLLQSCRVHGPHFQRQACPPDPPGGHTRPFWACSSAPQATAQDWEATEPSGPCAAPKRGFHLYALVPVPRPGCSPGKHSSQSNKEDSFLLLLLTNDSFRITFGMGSCKSFFKACVKFILQTTRIYVAPTMCEALF